MTALTQLEVIRAEAMERLTQNSDYRLVSKLDELITELQTLETTETRVDLLNTDVETSDEIDTLAENYVATELDEKFDVLSNEFCTTVREENALNGSASH